MYDSLTLWLPTASGDELSGRFFSALTGYEERTIAQTGEVYHFGMLDNLRIKSTRDGVSINGSLARFHLCNNLETLTREETGRAIERLSDALGLSVAASRVMSLEFGANLRVSRRPSEYFAHLGEAPRYRRSVVMMRRGHGLYYTNSRRSLVFYDKLREVRTRKRGNRIPEELIGRNLLRYELRIGHRLSSQLLGAKHADRPPVRSDSSPALGTRSAVSARMQEPREARMFNVAARAEGFVSGATLQEPTFYRGLVERWHAEYMTIQRLRILRPLSGSIGGPREIKDQLAAFGIESLGGVVRVTEMLRGAKQRGELDPEHYKRIKRTITKLATSPVFTEESEAIAELDRGVKELAECSR